MLINKMLKKFVWFLFIIMVFLSMFHLFKFHQQLLHSQSTTFSNALYTLREKNQYPPPPTVKMHRAAIHSEWHHSTCSGTTGKSCGQTPRDFPAAVFLKQCMHPFCFNTGTAAHSFEFILCKRVPQQRID
ncbi:hypothetical protein AB205_0197950, partial [Aquarana catesbeiana]